MIYLFNKYFCFYYELHLLPFPFNRGQAIGMFCTLSRLGAALAPVLVHILTFVNPALPFLIIAGFNVLCGLLGLTLRETLSKFYGVCLPLYDNGL